MTDKDLVYVKLNCRNCTGVAIVVIRRDRLDLLPLYCKACRKKGH